MSSVKTNTVIDYSPAAVEINNFPHGDTFLPDEITVTDNETGDPVDMTTYDSAAMRIEERDGTEVVTLTDTNGGIVLGDGFIQFVAETVDWPSNCTLYGDLQLITSGGNTETWAKFVIQMKRTITPP